MKKIILLLIAIILLSGCTKSRQKNELNVLNWSSYIPDAVLRNFEIETGINLNYGTYSSNEECLAKVSSSKLGTYDMAFPSDYMVELMIERDFLEVLDKTKLENVNNLNSQYLQLPFDKNNNYSLPFLAATTVIAYNSNRISENIVSYNDLLNPKYKNNLVVLDDQRILIGAALQALSYDMNETDEKKLEEAKDWLLKLKKNIKAFDSDSPKTFLISNEVDIAFLWNAEASLAVQENPDIKVIYPIEGFAISLDNFTILKGAKNVDNAYKFIDYILKPEVMKKIIEDYPYKNVNKASEALLSHDYLNDYAANTPDYILTKSSFVKNIGTSILDYDKIWAEIK